MSENWLHQVRLYVDEAGRARLDDPAHELYTVLARHDGVLVSQLDAFEAFLADPVQAASPLGRWTATTLADPEKRATASVGDRGAGWWGGGVWPGGCGRDRGRSGPVRGGWDDLKAVAARYEPGWESADTGGIPRLTAKAL